ncbi:hypothetical protein PMZ83_09560 [[Clostridium] symbiosum]|uniref:hypothetical protein n=1 Tax=Clostridium symbiosum TaxID=1512 RepID=UPI00232B011A|nr:hypothetical protein [[Clostridium] symbiosum]MDB1977886.1 hypothetical protein [[Clostridium] symbiosum]
MATNTTNYSFKKPDESDFYDVQDQNGNWDMADEALKSLDTPTFEDYTGSTPVPAANTAIDGIKSKTKLSALMSNIKAAFKGACLIGHIVNNCVTNNPNLPLSAAQGKVLMDLYTRLNGDAIKKNQTNIFETRQEIACTGDVKLVLRSTDADNCCGIEAQDADGNVLGRFGFYPHYGGWSIDGKPIATK